jgi:hypothetical protein
MAIIGCGYCCLYFSEALFPDDPIMSVHPVLPMFLTFLILVMEEDEALFDGVNLDEALSEFFGFLLPWF